MNDKNPSVFLSEYFDVYQKEIADGIIRRFFVCSFCSLMVWYDSLGAIIGFQICYGEVEHDKALSWFSDSIFSHRFIESNKITNPAPVLQQNILGLQIDFFEIFYRCCSNIDVEIVDYVKSRESAIRDKCQIEV